MFEFKKYFQAISYLQYPFMVLALFYAYKPFFNGLENILEDFNHALIWMGLGISFSTLQDTTKTQNKLSLKVWQNPKYAKVFIYSLTSFTLFLFIFGIFGIFISSSEVLKEIAFGLVVLAIGLLGMLKAAIEMAENHAIRNKG
jgi:hypothetical protein